SKLSAAMSGCLRCSSSALAMPVSPSAARRSSVGCLSIAFLSFLRPPDCSIPGSAPSVVVAGATDVAVPDRRGLRRRFSCVGFVEPVLQDGSDGAVGGGADVVATPTCGFDPGSAVAAREPQDAEAGAEALFRMRLGLHDGLHQG